MAQNFRDNLKGRKQAFFDDIQAVIRIHGYDESLAEDVYRQVAEDQETE